MAEYIITIEDWFFEYAHERYTHFFGCPIEEIVRCKDCKHYNDSDAGCNLFVLAEHKLLHVHNPDGFCSYAERRGE